MAALTKIKEVANAVLYRHGEGEKAVELILLKNVRLSYPFVGTPSEDENDSGVKTKKWRVQAMLPKATHVAAKDLVKEVIERLIKKNEATIPKDRWFMTNGDDKEDVNMHAHWLVSSADGKIRPTARRANGQVIDDIDEIDKTFYGGCWGNVMIRPWYFDGKSKNSTKPMPKRIVAGLTGVQFVKNDEPFGTGRIDTEDAWEAVDEDGGDGMGESSVGDDL